MAFSTFAVHAQKQKMPKIMVIPSDKFCENNGYGSYVEEMGRQKFVPDYRMALLKSHELEVALSSIGQYFQIAGFDLNNLGMELKKLEESQMESNYISGREGGEVQISINDKLLQQVKADIILDLNIGILGGAMSGYYGEITLNALDPFSGKQFAQITESTLGREIDVNDVNTIVKIAVQSKIDDFQNQLISHFYENLDKGREIRLTIQLFDSCPFKLDDYFDYEPLGIEDEEFLFIVKTWIRKNSKNGVFNMESASSNKAVFTLMMPVSISDSEGIEEAIDANDFIKPLGKIIRRDPFNCTNGVLVKGQGEILLMLGEKLN